MSEATHHEQSESPKHIRIHIYMRTRFVQMRMHTSNINI